MNNTLLTSISVLCFLSCSLFLACTAYCFPTTHDEKVVKEAMSRPRWNWTSPEARMCRQPMRRSHGEATEAFRGGG